jgi:sec-independent protein translocase protein TatC
MNIWDHLGELRKRILICLYVLLAGLPIGAFAVNPVISWLARPVGELVFVQPMEAFTAQLEIAVGVSFLLVLPVLLYQTWAFVSTGLSDREKTYFRWIIPAAYLCFMAGVVFSTFWVFPRAVQFLMTLKSRHLVPMLSVEAFLKFFMLLGLAFGLLFQLPLVLHFLAKLGILKADLLMAHRRISYFLIFLAATIFNPVPEVLTQLVLAGAAIALFEISILLVRWETRRQTGDHKVLASKT